MAPADAEPAHGKREVSVGLQTAAFLGGRCRFRGEGLLTGVSRETTLRSASEYGRRGVTPTVEPAYVTSGAMDGAAQAHPSERRPGWPQ